jgi:hypothetical protein
MTERLSHELASLLAEDDGRSDRIEARGLLRARLARTIAEGLGQTPLKNGVGEVGTIDYGRIAAYLDCSLSRAERDAIAVKLIDDPVLRSEVAAAVLLLDGLEAHPKAIPAELVARAVGVLATVRPTGPQAPVAGRTPVAIWWRRPAAWSAVTAVLLVAVLTPAVVSMVRERNPASPVPDAKGVRHERGLVLPPAGKGKDIQSCDDPSGLAKDLHPKAPDRSAQPPSGTPDDDPCRPKPADEGVRKP